MERPTIAIQRLTSITHNPPEDATVDATDIRAVLAYLEWLELEGVSIVHGGTGNDMRGAVISFGDISGGDIVRGRTFKGDKVGGRIIHGDKVVGDE